MKRLLTHNGYEVFVRPAAGELYAQTERPGRHVAIADIPAVSLDAREAALRPPVLPAIERGLSARR